MSERDSDPNVFKFPLTCQHCLTQEFSQGNMRLHIQDSLCCRPYQVLCGCCNNILSNNGVQDIVNNPAVRACLPLLSADTELEGWLLKCCCTPQTLHLQSTLAIYMRLLFIQEHFVHLWSAVAACANRYGKWQDATTVFVICSSANDWRPTIRLNWQDKTNIQTTWKKPGTVEWSVQSFMTKYWK